MKPQRILIVDDEVKIAEVVRSYLEKEGYEVFEAYDCAQAQQILDNHEPNLMILDLMLPDMSGEEFCRHVRKKSRIPIIMLTAKVEEASILKGLEIGADDYVTKPFSVRQLVARVQALLRRSGEESLPLANLISFNGQDLVVEPQKHEVRKRGELVNLTPNEFKILMTLVSYPNKVFTREELIVSALGMDFEGFDRTIDSHIKNIRQKIETETKDPKYILTVHGIGYRFGGE
jgi:DNA-binding response OmpR family regulator